MSPTPRTYKFLIVPVVQLVECLLATRQVEGCDQGLEHFSPFSTGRGDFASRRRPVRRFFPYRIKIAKHTFASQAFCLSTPLSSTLGP